MYICKVLQELIQGRGWMGWLDTHYELYCFVIFSQSYFQIQFQEMFLKFSWRYAPDPYKQSGHAHETVPCHKLMVLYHATDEHPCQIICLLRVCSAMDG